MAIVLRGRNQPLFVCDVLVKFPLFFIVTMSQILNCPNVETLSPIIKIAKF